MAQPTHLQASFRPASIRLFASGIGGFLAANAGVAIAYYVAGRVGLAMPFTSGNVSPVWPAAGLAVAAFLLFGHRVWPGVALAAFLVNYLSPLPASAALGISLGNSLGPALGTWLFRRQGFDSNLQRLRDLLALIGYCTLIGTAVSATIGVSVLYQAGVHPWSGVVPAWLIWWFGDGMGVLLLAPFLLTIPQWFKAGSKERLPEFLGLMVMVVCGCIILFDSRIGLRAPEDLLAFGIFPLVIWAGVRFEVGGAAAVSCTVAVLAVWETALGFGPFFRNQSTLHNAGVLQAYLAVISASGLFLAVVMAEKRQVQDAYHRQTQRSLASASQRLQLAQQAANIGAWEWNLRTNIVSWSEELEAIHGFPPGGFDGRYATWLSTVHPEDCESVQREALAAVREQRAYDVEYRSLRPDGQIYWTAARGRVLSDENGEPERLIGICMDITARKIAEQALRSTEKLAAAGRLAATMAHEINNPLEAVTNLLFLAGSDPGLSDGARQYLTMADDELRRVGHIAKRTLAFYRDSSAPTLVDMAQAFDEVLSIFQSKLDSKHIRVVKKYRGQASLLCNADEIRQVLSNIVLNAIDASRDSGTLHVRLSNPSLSGVSAVRICVADNGCGIPVADKSRIFEPFFTTKKDIGTGLGLWVTRGIVQKHGGSIRIRSSVRSGRSGTTLWVSLPQAAKAVSGQAVA